MNEANSRQNHMGLTSWKILQMIVIEDAGKISMDIAKDRAETEYEKYRIVHVVLVDEIFFSLCYTYLEDSIKSNRKMSMLKIGGKDEIKEYTDSCEGH